MKETTENQYFPFGDEWKKAMMTLRKEQILTLWQEREIKHHEEKTTASEKSKLERLEDVVKYAKSIGFKDADPLYWDDNGETGHNDIDSLTDNLCGGESMEITLGVSLYSSIKAVVVPDEANDSIKVEYLYNEKDKAK